MLLFFNYVIGSLFFKMVKPFAKDGLEDSKSYRPISLLCIPYKIFVRLIHARVELIIEPLFPREQAEFRRGRSMVDQTVLLTRNIEDSFEPRRRLLPCLSI